MRHKQFTFWNTSETEQHVTLQFRATGAVMHLSRDIRRSVRPLWHQVGTWDASETMTIRFTTIEPYMSLAATHLARKGASVSMKGHPWPACDTQITSRATDKETDPDTLLGRTRRRSLDLGKVAKGSEQARQSIADMHAGIMARNT